MAKNTVWQWDETAANNTDVAGIDISGVTGKVKDGDNAIRAAMSQIITMEGKGSDVASAGTLTLGTERYYHVTGTTTITDIDFTDAVDGRWAWLIFDGALTLTHNSTTLKLPGGSSITTAAGDRGLFIQDSSDNIICLEYVRAASANIRVVRHQVFIASDTYTPHPNMVYCIIECVGGGGGGGGSVGSATASRGGGGGGSGGYARAVVDAATVGTSQVVTIGAGGAGSSGANGTAGGDTSVGSICIGKGGGAGTFNDNSTAFGIGGTGGGAGTGDATSAGSAGENGFGATVTTVLGYGGNGGSSVLGGAGRGALVAAGAANGGNAAGRGGGGGGAASHQSTSAGTGGTGGAGIVTITEYCSA